MWKDMLVLDTEDIKKEKSNMYVFPRNLHNVPETRQCKTFCTIFSFLEDEDEIRI